MGKKSRGLFDYEHQLKLINTHRPPLQQLNEIIEWEMFRAPIESVFVNVPRQRNTKEENDTIKEGKVPESFKENPTKHSQKDCDARWTIKNKERHYGYKNHINADMKTELITKYTTTGANIHNSQATQALPNEEDSVAYADSAYRSEEIEAYLASIQYKSHIHEKGYRNKVLDRDQQLKNKMKSKIRVRVEHAFGFMTNSMNNGLNLKAIRGQRIDLLIGLLNLTYNLFRYKQIVRLQRVIVS